MNENENEIVLLSKNDLTIGDKFSRKLNFAISQN